MDATLARRRNLLLVLYLIQGVVATTWVVRTPGVRDMLQASTTEMGLILAGMSLGAMAGILVSARLVRLLSTRSVIILSCAMLIIGIYIAAIAVGLASATWVFAGLFCIGASFGVGEVPLSLEGADVERRMGRSLMPVLHGFFSLGTLLGALLGMLLTWLEFPVVWHFMLAGAIAIVPVTWACQNLVPGLGETSHPGPAQPKGAVKSMLAFWRDPKLMMIGLIVMTMALAEGSAMDWLPLLMVDGHGFNSANSSLIFVGFSASMTVGRLCSTWFLQRIGRVAGMRMSALCAMFGLSLVIFADQTWLLALAVPFWGIGACLGFPLGISSAANGDPHNGGRRVAAVVTLGYLAFLAGPPILGFLGDHFGLRSAMMLVLLLTTGVLFLASAVAPVPHTEAENGQ